MTEHDEETHRGGLRGAVDELFGRGERTDGQVEGDRRDEHLRDDTTHRDAAYADESGLDREPGTAAYDDTQSQSQSQYAGDAPLHDDAQSPYGNEVRGETVTPEQVQGGGDPTAHGQFQHGGEVRGDTDLPGQSRYDDSVPSSEFRGDETAVHTGYADDASQTDPALDRASVGQHTGDPVGTDVHEQDVTPVPAATTPATTTPEVTRTSAGTGNADLAAAHDSDDDGRAALVTADRADSYGSRWNEVKGDFVDEPRRAVANADALVGELLDELQELFKAQRADIEHSLDADETSTEDLRLALRRYRSFFDRLLSI